jgi:hypothetical protein
MNTFSSYTNPLGQNLMTNLTHYHLVAEQFSDEHGPAIMLTQQSGLDDPDTIMLHPWQLRAACEQFGLIASDLTAQKTIAMLTRRLLVLRDRIDHLGDYLTNCSDHEHANLEYELTYITATADIAQEFCADLDTMADAPQTDGECIANASQTDGNCDKAGGPPLYTVKQRAAVSGTPATDHQLDLLSTGVQP